jgi:hypothetical protein
MTVRVEQRRKRRRVACRKRCLEIRQPTGCQSPGLFCPLEFKQCVINVVHYLPSGINPSPDGAHDESLAGIPAEVHAEAPGG